ncbi:YcaO-like family protein [Bradyrhizobium sp. 930_D9_N1_4]|uniref:YcaO-like family protein n=1 Tax=Bradyrhizobium sp. 930_D9_N1_4 TaxID=3240374 RepID=UPI003F8C6972
MNLVALDLHSHAGQQLLDSIAGRASAELMALAGRLGRVFSIASPFAPGLHCIGGEVGIPAGSAAATAEVTRLSVTGNGETQATALVSCLGEAAEYLSQFERPGDVAATVAASDRTGFVSEGWVGQAVSGADRAIDCVNAIDATTGEIALLPADLCLRRPQQRGAIEPVSALSSGAAAGPSFEAAALRAVLELCERDAAAMWWLGGRHPKRFATEHPVTRAGAELIAQLRQGETARQTMLFDITTECDVPAVAAVSLGRDGRGMACGLSSRLTASDAARAAVLEMCQMEMAAPVAEAKRAERGDAALNAADRRHLLRAGFAAADCALLQPGAVSSIAPGLPISGLKGLTGHLQSRGIRLFLVDHTRPDIGVAVARAVSPDLQPFSAAVSTRRFSQARSHGESRDFAGQDIPLL